MFNWFVVRKVGKFEGFLTGFALIWSKISGKWQRRLSLGYGVLHNYFIVSRRDWKIYRTTWDPSPTGDMTPALTWRHGCPDDKQSPRSYNTNKKLSEPFSQGSGHSFKVLLRGKILSDKRKPLKILRSSFLTVLYLLNMINFKFAYCRIWFRIQTV